MQQNDEGRMLYQSDNGHVRTWFERIMGKGAHTITFGTDDDCDRREPAAPFVEAARRVGQTPLREAQEFAPRGRRRTATIEGRQPVDLDELYKASAGRRRPVADIAAELTRELGLAAASAENRRADLAKHANDRGTGDADAMATEDQSAGIPAGTAAVAPGPDSAALNGGTPPASAVESSVARAPTITADEQLEGLDELGAQVLATFRKIIVKARTTAENERATVEDRLADEQRRSANLASEVADLRKRVAELENWMKAAPVPEQGVLE